MSGPSFNNNSDFSSTFSNTTNGSPYDNNNEDRMRNDDLMIDHLSDELDSFHINYLPSPTKSGLPNSAKYSNGTRASTMPSTAKTLIGDNISDDGYRNINRKPIFKDYSANNNFAESKFVSQIHDEDNLSSDSFTSSSFNQDSLRNQYDFGTVQQRSKSSNRTTVDNNPPQFQKYLRSNMFNGKDKDNLFVPNINVDSGNKAMNMFNDSNHIISSKEDLIIRDIGDLSGNLQNTFKRQNGNNRTRSRLNVSDNGTTTSSISNNNNSNRDDDEDPAVQATKVYNNFLRSHQISRPDLNRGVNDDKNDLYHRGGLDKFMSDGELPSTINTHASNNNAGINLITPALVGFEYNQEIGRWVQNDMSQDISISHSDDHDSLLKQKKLMNSKRGDDSASYNLTSSTVPNSSVAPRGNANGIVTEDLKSNGKDINVLENLNADGKDINDVLDDLKSNGIIINGATEDLNAKTNVDVGVINQYADDSTPLITPRLKKILPSEVSTPLQRERVVVDPRDVTNIEDVDMPEYVVHKEELVKVLTEVIGPEAKGEGEGEEERKMEGEDAWKHVETLCLNGRGLKSIVGICDFLPELVELDVSENGIETISERNTLGCIIRLNLCKNKLKEMYFGLSDNWIEVLNVSDNECFANDLKFIDRLPHLREITVSNCGIERLQGLNRKSRIDSLDLSHNNIGGVVDFYEIISGERHTLQGMGWLHVKHLNLSGNKIVEIRGIDLLTRLETINLNNNPLERVTFHHGDKLQNFSLRELQMVCDYHDTETLVHVDGMAQFQRLQRISLPSYPGLSRLVETIAPCLQAFEIRGGSAVHLTSSVWSHLPRGLQRLAITHMADLQELPSVITLAMAGSDECEPIECSMDLVLSSLTALDLSHNDLRSWRNVVRFVPFMQLRALALQGNPRLRGGHVPALRRAAPALRTVRL